MFKECAMQYSVLTGMHFAIHEYFGTLFSILMKLGNFGEKKGLWQSQDHIYLKEFCPEKKWPWVTAGTRHAIRKHNFIYHKLVKYS